MTADDMTTGDMETTSAIFVCGARDADCGAMFCELEGGLAGSLKMLTPQTTRANVCQCEQQFQTNGSNIKHSTFVLLCSDRL